MKVIVFPGGFNLPIWVAQEQGFFAREGVVVDLTMTPGSVYQMTHLISGEFDIAHTAIDNVIAYNEGQGKVKVKSQLDLIAFMGCDNGFLHLITQPEIHSYADLKGKQLSVDAVTTGYAFVLRKMLEVHGLREEDYKMVTVGGVQERWQTLLKGEYDGTLLISPFEVLAQQQGLHHLGNALDILGQYQGTVAAARRAWAVAHSEELTRYIRAYLSALTWIYDPANHMEVQAILQRNISVSPLLAAQIYQILTDPVHGFSRTASLDIEGIQTVLALRSLYAAPRKILSEPSKYIALDYYEQAVGSQW